jgi:hypothetical protein
MNTELAWAAGFFDGEGSVGCMTRQRGAARYLCIQAQIAQVDRRVLDRFKRAVSAGKVNGPYARKSPKHKAIYRWGTSQFKEVEDIFALLDPHLSPVKRKQFRRGLSAARAYRRGSAKRIRKALQNPERLRKAWVTRRSR